ncbi:hypothetical protein DFH06DRAFT_512559 [Mycena polygramma]|nr:hypothetical protein DFH06DRAFT_512559 [Mycena polygramma]
MASTSHSAGIPRAQPIAPTAVVLPGIHEMFPEHLMGRPAYPRTAPFHASSASDFPQSEHIPTPPPLAVPPSFSFDVLQSNPRGSSLTHIASSRPTSRPTVNVNVNLTARSTHSASGSSDGDEMDLDVDEIDDGEGDAGEGEEEWDGKKHVCPNCAKRFNRPSSLRIHVNTHTGATPYRCPYPDCGRAFNVNSNMRRHWRNHNPHSRSNSDPNSADSPISPPVFSPGFRAHPYSPSSPPSATWSVSSARSPITPLSPLALSPRALPTDVWPSKGRGGYANTHSVRESDMRSQRG